MKRLLLSGLMSLILLPSIAWATDDTYVNNGNVIFPPQIDATNVINNGTFDFRFNTTVLPFDTSNTRNFTNTGNMVGSVGFRFDNSPSSSGTRKLAANFRNRQAGVITAIDGIGILSQVDGQPLNTEFLVPSFLLISATNVINEGTVSAGAGGLLRMVGTNINLARSGVQIRPIVPQGSINNLFTNYFAPEIAIYDNYWGQTNQVMDSANIIQASGPDVIVTSPPSDVQFSPRFIFGGAFFGTIFGTATIQLNNPVGDFYTNTLAFTNIMFTNMTGGLESTNVPLTNVQQAVFVQLPASGDVNVGIRFFNSTDIRNPMKTASVGISLAQTNVVTTGNDLSSIYLVDTLASETNRSFYTNFTDLLTLRPQNYLLERLEPFEFAFGFSGNADFTPNFLYDTNFASATVTNDYAAYSAFVDNIASRPPNIPAGTVTNLPGRIEIEADSLDVTKTRFRADGLLNIRTKHLISSSNAVVDCENLSYTLGSTNGNLKVQNLAKESVTRFQGDIFAWSGVWTNQLNIIIPNFAPDPADTNVPPTKFIPAPLTNVTEVRLHALLVYAGDMLTEVPVVVNAMVTHSTNVAINDKMIVVQSFLIDGQSFTLNGSITFSNTVFIDTRGNAIVVSLDSWIATNAPNLLYFTNNGTLKIPREAHFGDDRLIPYSAFVNKANITAGGQSIASSYFENDGNLTANDGGIFVTTPSGKMEDGQISATADVQFFASVLKFDRSSINTGSRLDLMVTNSLFDAGGTAGNLFTCRDGFRLLIKPQTGDLLGTTFQTVAPNFAEVDHDWAGADRGPSAAGFSDNAAIGGLALTPEGFDPLFVFSGTGEANGLYVDFLDLSQLSDYQNQLQIDPNLVIYYAAASLSFTPPFTNGAPQQPEEYLDGQFNGHLRWVRDFAGPNSSVAVVSNGVSILVNRALRNSLIIDSDGDGIPNGSDFFPFDTVLMARLAVTNQPAMTAVLSWNATAQTVYQVQSADNFISPNWQTVLYYTNSATTDGVVTIQIPVPPGSLRQFYRVGTSAP
ncbi:MAG: hypothetical protein HY298_07515 [Verrucomicrobia bacterium]|nr:hypothetical protein [Verrucomicrobiota bacterium]